MPDVEDQRLLHALQLHPRIPWSRLGPVLGLDPGALSRRWTRLVSGGLAWTSCFPIFEHGRERLRTLALVEVQVAPGSRESTIRALGEHPEILSIHCTSGERDLYLTLAGPDVHGIDRFVDETVATVPRIVRTRTTYVLRTFQQGSSWRFDALTPDEAEEIRRTVPWTRREARLSTDYLRVIEALEDDTRRSVTSIHEETGRSISSVSRAIDAITSNGWAAFRVDVAERAFGWNVSAMLWLRVPAGEVERVGTSLTSIRQARFCASVAGHGDLAVTFWLQDLDELADIELRIARAFPGVEVVDRWVIPRVAKRSGHMLTAEGLHDHAVRTSFPTWWED